jgi:hypothetical protein
MTIWDLEFFPGEKPPGPALGVDRVRRKRITREGGGVKGGWGGREEREGGSSGGEGKGEVGEDRIGGKLHHWPWGDGRPCLQLDQFMPNLAQKCALILRLVVRSKVSDVCHFEIILNRSKTIKLATFSLPPSDKMVSEF